MRLRDLFEAKGKEASFAVGRLNPATIGHGLLVEAIKQGPGDPFLFLTDRPAKLPDNPLSPQEKLDWAKVSFPGIEIQLAKNIFPAAVKLYDMGYRNITFFEGERKLVTLLEKYNGEEGSHGFFDFEKINYVQLERDADADDATGMSGTKMREAAINNKFDEDYKHPKTGKTMPAFEKGVTDSAKPYARRMFEKLQGIYGVDAVDEQVDEISLFKTKDTNASVKEQDPNKLKVLDWIAARADGKEHFLSFYRKGAAWSGKLLFIRPNEAKKFIAKVEDNQDYLPQIKKALTSIATTSKLFDNLGIKHQIRNAD